jgi:flavodoxin
MTAAMEIWVVYGSSSGNSEVMAATPAATDTETVRM